MRSIDYGEKHKTAREKVFAALIDQEWHPRHQLEGVGGNRYCARLAELRREGWLIESRPMPRNGHGKMYRLTSLVRGEPLGKCVKVYLDEYDARKIANHYTITKNAHTQVVDALASFESNRSKL